MDLIATAIRDVAELSDHRGGPEVMAVTSDELRDILARFKIAAAKEIFEQIKHGDETHRQWLNDQLEIWATK